MNPSVLFGIILLIVVGGGSIVVALTGNLARSTPAPPPLDTNDIDAEHRLHIIAMFAVKP